MFRMELRNFMNPCDIEDAVDWPKHFTLVCHISFVLHRCLVIRKCLVTPSDSSLFRCNVQVFFSDPICNPFLLIYSLFFWLSSYSPVGNVRLAYEPIVNFISYHESIVLLIYKFYLCISFVYKSWNCQNKISDKWFIQVKDS